MLLGSKMRITTIIYLKWELCSLMRQCLSGFKLKRCYKTQNSHWKKDWRCQVSDTDYTSWHWVMICQRCRRQGAIIIQSPKPSLVTHWLSRFLRWKWHLHNVPSPGHQGGPVPPHWAGAEPRLWGQLWRCGGAEDPPAASRSRALRRSLCSAVPAAGLQPGPGAGLAAALPGQGAPATATLGLFPFWRSQSC